MLRGKLQEEGLRTYLLAYGRFYSSLSIAQLCDMFDLPERKVGLHKLAQSARACVCVNVWKSVCMPCKCKWEQDGGHN